MEPSKPQCPHLQDGGTIGGFSLGCCIKENDGCAAVVELLTNALGKCQFVDDRTRPGSTTVKRGMV